MGLKHYVENAIRTESHIEDVVVDPRFLGSVLAMNIAVGNMLDQIKKHVFYDKEYNAENLKKEFVSIVQNMDDLQQAIKDIEYADTKMIPYLNEGAVDVNTRLFHAIVGTATESTELIEALALMLQGETDSVNILEEFGDINWYQAIAIDELKGDWVKTLKTNIAKLKARYPEKFTEADAIDRNLKAERKILESNPMEP